MRIRTSSGLALAVWSATGLGHASSGWAADLAAYKAPSAVAAVHNWTGFYLGAHVGFGWSQHDYSSQFIRSNGVVEPEFFAGERANSGLAGLQLGANWQAGNVVFGVEGDLSYTDIRADASVPFSPLYESRNRWLGTATGRLGYAFENVLIYAKGGAAFSDVSMTAVVEGEPLQGRSTRTGWTLGGGFEYGIAPNWSLKAEYLYFDFADESFASPFRTNGTLQYKLSERLSTVKFGFNYRFGAGKAAVVAKY